MAYVKQNFYSGQVLTADHMNHIENGIVEAGGAVAKSTRYIHMSFDDVTDVVTALAGGTLSSVWDNPFMAMLKKAHEDYGFVFSLYLQTKPASVSSKHQTELRETSSWLKWGLHSLNGGNYASSSYSQGKTDWESMVDVVMSLTGTQEAVDRCPRLHQFYGSEDALKGMRDAKIGALGFLSTDDTRDPYYLSKEKSQWLYEGENDHLTDFKNGLVFYRTDLRLDWFSGAGFTYNAASGMSNHAPASTSDIAGELEIRYKGKLYQNTWDCFAIFTHQWQPVSAITSALNAIGEFALGKGISFDFPQNRVATPTDMDIRDSDSGSTISVDSALSASSTNPVQNKVINASITSLQSYIKSLEERVSAVESSGGAVEKYTVTYNLTHVTANNSLASVIKNGSYQNTLTAALGYTLGAVVVTMGGSDVTSTVYNSGNIYIPNVTGNVVITATGTASEGGTVVGTTTGADGRAITILNNFTDAEPPEIGTTQSGNDGGRITNAVGRASFAKNAFAVSGGATIVLKQVTTNLAFSMYEYTALPLNTDTATPGGQKAMAWLTSSTAVQSGTKYICVAFKNGDGSVDFTSEEAELLKTALTIG